MSERTDIENIHRDSKDYEEACNEVSSAIRAEFVGSIQRGVSEELHPHFIHDVILRVAKDLAFLLLESEARQEKPDVDFAKIRESVQEALDSVDSAGSNAEEASSEFSRASSALEEIISEIPDE
jgi:uncharacterized protein YpuA (DUF1002 family)